MPRMRRNSWAASVLSLLLAAGCTDGEPPAPSPSPTPSAVALVSTDLALIGITQLDQADAGADRAVGRGRDSFTVGKDNRPGSSRRSSALLAFAALPYSSDCVATATLTLVARGGEVGPVRVYPSAARSAALGRLPEGPGALLDNKPSADPTPLALGDQVFDVTDLVRLWATGGPFPSLGKTFEPGRPIVLNLRPPDLTDGSYSVEYAPAPRLQVTRREGCA